MADIAKKIIITDCYALNSGDVGILMAMVAEIQRGIPSVEIIIESTHPKRMCEFGEFDGLVIVPRIFDVSRHDSDDSMIKKTVTTFWGLLDSVSFLLWAGLTRLGLNVVFLIRPSRREQAQLLKKVDAFVSVGGGFLSSLYNYHFRLYVYLLGLVLDKKVIIFAQSVGPFETKLSRFLIPRFINRCAMVSIREPNSLDYFRRNGVKIDCEQTADAAFLLTTKKAEWIDRLVADGRTVAIGMKFYEVDSGKQQPFSSAVESLARYLREQDYRVLLVNHVAPTMAMSEDIAARIDSEVLVVPFGHNPRELKELCSRTEFIVSGIMHPTIFAAERAIPFVAIKYEPKQAGLIEMLGYDSRLLVDGRRLGEPDFNDTLISAVRLLEQECAALIESLKKSMPDVKELARKNIDLLRSAITD